jgi:hypothetical protein
VPAGGGPNLRELASRPERFEHHLVPVATIGTVQLELATASEPLYFAHVNYSDEYALALPTGDVMIEAFPMRTFLGDAAERDAGRYNHKVGDLVLHPVGVPHWPGRLRAPYAPMDMLPGMRRCGMSLVYCATAPTPAGTLPTAADARAKPYVEPAPRMSIVSVMQVTGVIAAVGDTTLSVVDGPVELPRGGWVIVLAGDRPGELVRASAGDRVSGFARALVFASAVREPDDWAPAWARLPEPPFGAFEDAAPGALPFAAGALRVAEADGGCARVAIGSASALIPRYWAARTLFRWALHNYRLGSIETYGGLRFADGGDGSRLAIELGDASTPVTPAIVEALYRAIAPAGYVERAT